MCEAQARTLKEWRLGKTHPTSKTLKQFFGHLDPDAYALPIVLIAMICIALDKQLEDPKMALWKEEFKACFSAQRYTIYFQHFKKNLPELAALE